MIAALFLFFFIPEMAHATVLWSSSAETRTCDTALAVNNASAPTFDGATWGFSSADNPASLAYPFPWVRCLSSTPSIQTPYGSNYIEWLTICNQALVSGRCDTIPDDQDISTAQAQSDVFPSGLSTLSMGTTYYLGGTFRFDLVGNNHVWLDGSGDDSFDKLFEFRFTGGRWIMNVGRDGNFVGNFNGQYMFSFGAATATECPECGGPAGVGWSAGACHDDRKMHNANGYTASAPRKSDYGHWYNVVLAVTLSTSSAVGRAELYINGVKVTDCSGQTATTGTSSTTGFSDISLHGTIAQPAYDSPPHYRRVDNMIFATTLTDVTNAGLMGDPEAGGGASMVPSGGALVSFSSQAFLTIGTVFQYLMILAFLWEQRAKVARAAVGLHTWYWGVRYRRAVRQWQQSAPLMVESRGETIDLRQHEDSWQFRK